MPIFKINGDKLIPAKETKFDLEKDIQKLTEKNLDSIFSLEFVCSEFQHNNLRIDTLAFDPESKAFIIIEYKKDKSFSVIDQGYAYLSLMLNNKADFILEFNEKKNQSLKREEVDWTQSKVIFIANSFTTYQQNAINFKDLPIELWEVNKYDNNTILYNNLKAASTSESIKTISKDETIKKVSSEVKTYSIEGLFSQNRNTAKEIYDILSEKILELDNRLEAKPKKLYIAFQANGYNLVALWPKSTGINIEMLRTRPQDVKDPEGKVKYYEKSIKYYNQHVSNLMVNKVDEIDYAMYIIKQLYKKFAERTLS